MNREWWHDKVAYQIYPKSFYDSNGDGIGDLPGIIEKLDYLKDLGVDIVWLSPIYRSPLADQGYDISDYYNIDPRFGTMEDMDRLLAETKKRDMHIVMDLVVNHCSDEHEWFKKACRDPEGPYGQYFYLKKLQKATELPGGGAIAGDGAAEACPSDADTGTRACGASAEDGPTDSCPTGPDTGTRTRGSFAEGGSEEACPAGADTGSDSARYTVSSSDGYVLPCNWRSYFGGPVWEKLPGREDWYYLHVFHKKQPDLNWENPEVREEIYRMINWWLDRGLAGFRIDAIINIKKELPFRNYAPDRADGLCSIHEMLHRAEGVGEFLGEMRDRTFKPHRAFTVGEVFDEKEGELPAFIGENGYFSTMFDFSEAVWGSSPAGWHANRGITPDAYKSCLFFMQKKTDGIGFLSNIIENHDEPRGVSRYIPEEDRSRMDSAMYTAAKKALATIYFFAKGLPWIYQGQEIGMENLPLDSIDQVDDISSIDAWKVMRELGISEEEALAAIGRNGRDNARSPFQWSAAPGAGFTTGTPWLRVNPGYRSINLEDQQKDPASVYSHYKKMIALRKDPAYKETFVYGSFEPYLGDGHNVISYLRSAGGQTILVISNYQPEPRILPLPAPVKRVLLGNLPDSNTALASLQTGGSVSLAGYQTLVLELKTL